MQIYLDNAATTPMDPAVLEAMLPFFKEHYGNPSAQHAKGRETRAAIEQARKTIARLIGAQASEIVFTSGGTEATNLALVSAVRDMGIGRIVTSPIEHHCVLHTAEFLARDPGVELEMLPVDPAGKVDTGALTPILERSSALTLVSVMHANNETGIMNDIAEIGRICKAHGALFHTDTVQTMAHFRFDLADLPVHFLTGSAHKFHGPKGAGFLFVRKGLTVKPLIHGGGQERNKRSGTENVYGIVGLARAMELAYADHDSEKTYVQGLKTRLLEMLRLDFPDLHINGTEDPGGSLYTVLNVSFPPDDRGGLLLFNLDMKGICVSGGSACSSGASTGSHVLRAMKADEDRISIRFSFSRFNTESDIEQAAQAVREVYGLTGADQC